MSEPTEPRRAIYREDGGKYLVDVLSDSTENGKRTVKWVLVATVRRSPLHPVIEPGDQHEVTCVKGYEAYVGWELEYEQHL